MTQNTGCVCPGSYDPLTLGHLNIIRRARRLFAQVYVGVLDNGAKHYMFSAEARVAMAERAVADMSRVRVVRWDGLLINLLDDLQVDVIVRGARGSADYTWEEQVAAVNRTLRPRTETVVLPADDSCRAVSSTVVRELLSFGGDPSPFLPPGVLEWITLHKR